MTRPSSDHPVDLLAEYANDELEEIQAQGVRLHILDCPECLRAVEEFRLVSDVTSLPRSEPMPRQLSDRILMETIGRPSRETLAEKTTEEVEKRHQQKKPD